MEELTCPVCTFDLSLKLQEAQRAIQALNPIERAVFALCRAIIGNRRARSIFVVSPRLRSIQRRSLAHQLFFASAGVRCVPPSAGDDEHMGLARRREHVHDLGPDPADPSLRQLFFGTDDTLLMSSCDALDHAMLRWHGMCVSEGP
jgi:hypothetical protein